MTSEKKVALTFDDGPANHYPPQILDILSENNIPATFFVVGVIRIPPNSQPLKRKKKSYLQKKKSFH
ncbi:polysaccharide deacetylase family protein [Bacillus albus]